MMMGPTARNDRMGRWPLLPLVAAGLFLPLAAAQPLFAASVPAASEIDGLWINPKRSVVVRTGACGAGLCGWVVWASAKAKADSRESGVEDLIGLELLRDYRRNGHGSWSGRLYVPDMGSHYASTLTRIDATSLKIRGCLIGGFICKSQVWRRLDQLPER